MHPIKVCEIMTRDIFIISPEKTVEDAAKLMKEIDSGILPVGTHPEKVIGMISDRDIVLRVTAEGKHASRTPVGEAMTRGVYSCDAETDLETAASAMHEHSVRRLLVTRGNTAIGIVTLAELLRNQGQRRISDNILHELLGTRRKHAAKTARTAT